MSGIMEVISCYQAKDNTMNILSDRLIGSKRHSVPIKEPAIHHRGDPSSSPGEVMWNL
jgi:hypothetical protein